MKNIYQSPEVEIMDFAAAEKLAALDLDLIGLNTNVGTSLPGDVLIP